MEQNCPHCQVSDETIKNLKESAGQTGLPAGQAGKKEEYDLKKRQKENERINKAWPGKIKKIIFFVLPAVLLVGAAIWGLENYKPATSSDKPKITVYLSPTCGCCAEYVSYLRSKGLNVEKKETSDMLSVKEKQGISSDIEGCHTSVVGDYFVEGMVPVEAINKLLAEKPKIKGITLPGMPENAPGMPGFNLKGLKVYQISEQGESSEFMSF